MTETQKRIEAYQNLLPGIREKVTAVALLLALSVVMLTSASFAWLTISRAPEVTAVSTNIAANGNLEIALVSSEIDEDGNMINAQPVPGESKDGDSMAKQDATAANITWGNLINLGDEDYGLNNLVLRPARLGTGDLNKYPLSAARYDSEGRIINVSSDFGYAKWKPETEAEEGYFAITEGFGVRAISSVTTSWIGNATVGIKYKELLGAAQDANNSTKSEYMGLNSATYMDPLVKIVQTYVQNVIDRKLSGSTTVVTVSVDDLKALDRTYSKLLAAFDSEADAIANIINTQIYLSGDDPNNLIPGNYTASDVYGLKRADITALNKQYGTEIMQLEQFITDHNTLVNNQATIQGMIAENNAVPFDSIYGLINNLIHIDTCKIKGKTISELSSDIMGAVGMLSGDVPVKIYQGILKRFEDRLGYYITISQKVTLKAFMTFNPTVIITTSAKEEYEADKQTKGKYFERDLAATAAIYQKGADENKYARPVETAEDTFGLAVDLWVRTNAVNSYLILEGKVKTEEREEKVSLTTKDPQGNTVKVCKVGRDQTVTVDGVTTTIKNEYQIYESEAMLWFNVADNQEIILENDEMPTKTDQKTTDGKDIYTITRAGANGNETLHIYQKKGKAWFKVDDHSRFLLEENETPVEEEIPVIDIVGFEGENRVWDENNLLIDADTMATTQGMGSCYVYYADTPEDQEQSLRLLKALEIAFVDGNGALLEMAYMDTEHAYEVNGRVTVPVIIDPENEPVMTREDGTEVRAITKLEQNVPTRITAIVYLNGDILGNDDVLSSAAIQGQLNIQFGSSQNLVSIDDEMLQSSGITVSANVTPNEFGAEDKPFTSTVEIMIDSTTEIENVNARFIRAINSTQGSREPYINNFTKQDGKWVAQYTFNAPGTYVLRTVEIDNQEYVLNDPQTVTIEGFAVSRVICPKADNNGIITVMTAESFYDVGVSVEFGGDASSNPRAVQGRFQKTDGSVINVNFKYNANNGLWESDVRFATSGEYVLRYLVVDGYYMELSSDKWITANIKLGMKVKVTTTSPTSFKYEPDKLTPEQENLKMKVWIMDDTGNELPAVGIGDTWLYYRKGTDYISTFLHWNSTEGYYEGELHSREGGIGKWQFGYVKSGANTISKATEAPVFTFISPEPPSITNVTSGSKYSGFNDAGINVLVANSSSANIRAYISKDGGEPFVVEPYNADDEGNNDGSKEWRFTIPSSGDGQEEGYYSLARLELSGVYDADGNEYTEENPMELIPGANSTYLYKTIHHSIELADSTTNLAGDEFLQVHTIAAQNFTVKLLNGEGKNLSYQGNTVVKADTVKLVFKHKVGTDTTYGGYTNSGLNGLEIEVPLTSINNNGVYTNKEAVQFIYAGEYEASLEYETIHENEVSLKSSGNSNFEKTLPKYIVSSPPPKVTISAITPEKDVPITVDMKQNGETEDYLDKIDSVDTDETQSGGCGGDKKVYNYTYNYTTAEEHVHNGATPRIDGLTAWVYFPCTNTTVQPEEAYTATSKGTSVEDGYGMRYHQYEYKNGTGVPSVTLLLRDLNNFKKAVLAFTPTGKMYKEYTKDSRTDTWWAQTSTSSYEWNAEGECKRFIGGMDNVDNRNGNDNKYAAGTITANTLVVTASYNGSDKDFTFTIPTITIHNPY